MERTELELRLRSGGLDEKLAQLYGKDGVDRAKDRCRKVMEGFSSTFACTPQALFSAPGRTEIGGNHTDHQHGKVLAASVDMDILCAAAPNDSGHIRVQSEGYSLIDVDLSLLTPQTGEENTSAALIRGVAARMAELGCDLKGKGLDAYMISDVLGGSGLSSSAAFEVLMGTILNSLFFGDKCTAVEIAQIGQYAENVFFGKPCGLMDQTASSVGGVVSIDFADPAHPIVEQVELDLHAKGYALCILDTHASHADLTGEYAAITQELKAVCDYFGKQVLREVPESDFFPALPRLRDQVGDRAVLRAIHIYDDNKKVDAELAALRCGDFGAFLSIVNSSGLSSWRGLQNVTPTGYTDHQEAALTITLCERLLGGRGACRIHGGGFGGTVQAFVPLNILDGFKSGMERILGPGSCHVVTIRPVGGVRLA